MAFLPKPQELNFIDGEFNINYKTMIVLNNTTSFSFLFAQMLSSCIKENCGLDIAITKACSSQGDIVLEVDSSLKANSYKLKISKKHIVISAQLEEGICHGVQTLCQYIQQKGLILPCLDIFDYPNIENRAYYLDVSRGRIPTLATLKQYADLLCRYKINQWQFYVEHSYLFRDFSEVWRDDTPLTAEEILELDKYCAERCIELVPSLSSFGHMYKILSTKSFCEFCELENSESLPYSFTYAGDHHTLNVSNPKSFDFIVNMLNEYAGLFSSKKFNICCDETFDLGKGRSKKLADEIGEKTLYMSHVSKLCQHVVNMGLQPMFWGDIVYRYADSYSMLPKETVCLNWGYLPNQREDEIRALAEVGATQYACPGVCGWNKWIPLIRESYENNIRMCNYAKKYKAIGILNTEWGDYGHINHPWLSKAGIIYGASFSWNIEAIDFESINEDISLLEYGDTSKSFIQGLSALSHNEIFDWFLAVRWIESKDEHKKREHFDELDFAKVPLANENIDNAIKKLSFSISNISAKSREIMQALSVISDGIKIWNNILLYIAKNIYEMDCDSKNELVLAKELEEWFFAYSSLWRSVSKESSLNKLNKIVVDYADFLRKR